MKYQLVTTDGENIIEKSELVLNEGDKLIITVSSPHKNYPPSVEQVKKWHEYFKTVLNDDNKVITKPFFIELSVLKVS